MAFDSGNPVKHNSYTYAFDEVGHFCVASQGAPGYAGSVNVIPPGELLIGTNQF